LICLPPNPKIENANLTLSLPTEFPKNHRGTTEVTLRFFENTMMTRLSIRFTPSIFG